MLLVLLAFILGGGGYLALHSGSPFLLKSPTIIQLTSAADCFLQERSCTAVSEQMQISLSLNPQPVPLMKPVQALVKVKGLKDLHVVELKVEGLNMYMGFQTAQLMRLSETDWQGSFSLPICSEREMQWRVMANLKSPHADYQASFNLSTHR